jgi:hypothetical protein
VALPDPRILPDALLRPVKFSLNFVALGAMSRTMGGAISFQETVGGALWQMSLESRPLRERDYGIAHAFFLSLKGGAKSFKAYDLRRYYPSAYGVTVLGLTRHGGGTFDGTCTLTAAGGGTISLSGLPDSYTMTAGDYISFPWLGSQRLVKATETLGGNTSGVLNNMSVEPWQLSGGTVPVTATLVKAWCLMRPVPGSWSGDRTNMDPVSFQAIESPG